MAFESMQALHGKSIVIGGDSHFPAHSIVSTRGIDTFRSK